MTDTNKEQQHGFFSSHKQPQQESAPPSQMTMQMGNMSRRIKIIEEALENMRKKAQLNEQNMLDSQKKQNANLRAFEEELTDMQEKISSLKDDLHLIVEELKLTAKSDDVKVLQKYIDLWNPVQFITAKEARRIVEDVLREQEQ
jgi:predicted  nucleic acid-binding Zn-ribbon protein